MTRSTSSLRCVASHFDRVGSSFSSLQPQRWKARLLGEPEPQFKKAVLSRTLPRPAFTGAEDDANRAALLAAADEQVRAEIEAAHKEALAAIEGTEAPAPK